MNITIQQSDQVIERNVPASVVEYLYNLGQVSGITLSGSIYLDGGTYLNYTDALSQWYPELYIAASKIYIAFLSSEVERVLLNNGYSTDGIGITLEDARTLKSAISSSLFRNNASITSFNELKYLTKVTLISSYAFLNSSLTEIDLSNITSLYSSCFYNCGNLTKINISSLEDWCNIVISGSNASPFSGNASVRLYLNGNEITNLVIPGTVLLIKDYAFLNLKGITSLTLQNGVRYIEDDAFNSCSDLNVIDIPSSLESIDYHAFYNCTNLNRINIEDLSAWCNIDFKSTSENNPLYYAHHLYLNGSEIVSLNIPNDVTTINKQVFAGASGITSVNIPNSVTTIEERSFSDCTGLTNVTIPDSVTNIKEFAFYNCTNLTSVVISNTLTSLSRGVFYNCSKLGNVTIPNSVTNIGRNAFYNCAYLTSINIPNSVTTVGECIFGGTRITSLTVPGTIVNIPGGTREYSENGPFSLMRYLESVVLENGIQRIEDGSYRSSGSTLYYWGGFYMCDLLRSLTIPASLTYIGKYAFYSCSVLDSIYISDLDAWCNLQIGDSAFSGNRDRHLYLNNNEVTSVTIPNGLTSVHKSIFSRFAQITEVIIPDSVTSIEDQAFYGCSGLSNITWSNNLTTIGSRAFYGCHHLTTITLPNSITTLGTGAFYDCDNLVSINIPDGVTSIPNELFRNCAYLASITLPSGLKSIGSYAFTSCSRLASAITIPSGVTSISGYAFSRCSSLPSITVEATTPPSTLTSAFLNTSCPIYVPAESVDAYKAASGWSSYASRIQAIPSNP